MQKGKIIFMKSENRWGNDDGWNTNGNGECRIEKTRVEFNVELSVLTGEVERRWLSQNYFVLIPLLLIAKRKYIIIF